MKSFTCLFLFSMVCASLASPASEESHPLVRHRRQLDFFQNTGISSAWENYRKLVQELINNLNKAADQAKDAVNQFNNGLLEQARQCRERFLQNLKNLQDRVTQSIKDIQDRFTGSGSAISECINSYRDDAEAIYHQASEQMAGCTDMRLQEGEELMHNVNVLGEQGQEIASNAFAEMRNCTHEHAGSILAVGSCIGSVALRTEVKGASFLMQSGLAIGRLNLFMSTLPASLEVCAGSSLVNAGMGTARVLMDIGSCSTNSVINAFSGGSTDISSTDGASAAAVSVSSASGSASAAVSSASSSAADAINTILRFP